MSTLLQDLKYGIRMLAKNPGFTMVAVLTLALGIGANTAIFSVVNAVMLKPLPFHDPDRLVMVWATSPQQGSGKIPVTPADFSDWKTQNHVFEEMGTSSDELYTLTGAGDPESIVGYDFSANFLHVMGVKPELGRAFLPAEESTGNNHVAILSHRLWVRRFNSDPKVIGRPIMLDGISCTVIGVMPPRFQHPQMVELWTPLALSPAEASSREASRLRIVARLRPGVSLKQAQADMDAIARRLADLYPKTNTGVGVKVEPIRDVYVGDIRPALLVLLAAVGFVLLIACANVANLLLARATARQKEFAVRAALGASRLRLARQFLTESLLLSLAGASLGLLMAVWSTGFLVTIFPNNIANLSIPQVDAIPIDGRVLGFTVLAAVVTSLIFGIAPALRATRPDLNQTLKDAGRRATADRRGRRLRDLLVVSEVTLSLMLLIGAGLMIKSFIRLQQGDLGFNPDHVLGLQLILPHNRYPDGAKRRAFIQEALRHLESTPGVQSAAAIHFLPLLGFSSPMPFTVEGHSAPLPSQEPMADNWLVSPKYFETMGVPLLEGRDFQAQDSENAPKVAIINRTLARRLFPGENPIGKRLNLGDEKQPGWWQIVGIVGDVKPYGLETETHADIYKPINQIPFPVVAFTVRTGPEPISMLHAIEKQIWAVDKDQAFYKVVTLKQMASESIALRRVSMTLLAAFATVALLLSAVGIYGVMSYLVAQRTHEIGVRMALGAEYRDVLRLVVGEGFRLALLGVGLGVLGAIVLTRFMSSLLFGVRATDPLTYVAVSLGLTAVALLASYIPARRATKVDPMVALRYE